MAAITRQIWLLSQIFLLHPIKITVKLLGVIRNRFEELRLRKSREEGEKLPLKKIGAKTGLSETTLWRLSNGTNTRIDYTTIDVLCRYFGCSLGELLEYVEDKE